MFVLANILYIERLFLSHLAEEHFFLNTLKQLFLCLVGFKRLFTRASRCINSAKKIARNPPELTWCKY